MSATVGGIGSQSATDGPIIIREMACVLVQNDW